MSRQLFVIKTLGITVVIASIALAVFLIKIINTYNLIAFIYLLVPVATFVGGMMLLFAEEK